MRGDRENVTEGVVKGKGEWVQDGRLRSGSDWAVENDTWSTNVRSE